MDKITYLNYLEDELSKLPKHDRDKIMYDYENKFFEAEKNGVNENEFIKSLSSPKTIAKRVYASQAIRKAEKVPNMGNVLKAILATLGISFFNIIFLAIPTLICSFIFLLIILAGSLLLIGPVLAIFNVIVNGFQWVEITNVIFSISFLGLGLMLIIFGIKLIEIFYRMILRYLRWSINLIRRSAV